MLMLHVEPRDRDWVVRRDGADVPLSRHPDAGAATRAACARAYMMATDSSVLVHDRYHRVHEESPHFSAEPAARSRIGPVAHG